MMTVGGPQPAPVEPVDPSSVSDVLPPASHHASGAQRRLPGVMLLLSTGWLLLLVVLAVSASWLPLKGYDVPSGTPYRTPGLRFDEPLGTDFLGRSVLSRCIWGARVSLAVGTGAVAIGLVVGGGLGLIAGYAGRRIDQLGNLAMDVLLAFPSLIMLLALTAFLTPSVATLTVALSILSFPSYFRLARANTFRVKEREFVRAARNLGAGPRRILVREILPNILFPVLSYAFVVVATVIVAEGSLSFLGLGVPPPQPSWGGMIASARDALADHPHGVYVPAIVLLLTVLSLNVVGDRLRARLEGTDD